MVIYVEIRWFITTDRNIALSQSPEVSLDKFVDISIICLCVFITKYYGISIWIYINGRIISNEITLSDKRLFVKRKDVYQI